MILSLWLLLSILSLARFSQAHGKLTCIEYDCDDEQLKIILKKFELLETENDNLSLQMDKMKTIMNQKFQHLQAITNCTGTKSTKNSEPELSSPTESPTTTILPSAPTSVLTTLAPSTTKPYLPCSCDEALLLNGSEQGIYKIRIPGSSLGPFSVHCMSDPNGDGGAWTVIQRRLNGSVDFQKPWSDYARGFGDLEGDFWMGFEKIRELARTSEQELWIQMEDYENNTHWAKYWSFNVDYDTNKKYFGLSVMGLETSNDGDSLEKQERHNISRREVHNDDDEIVYYAEDDVNSPTHCAKHYNGVFWRADCDERYLGVSALMTGPYAEYLEGQGLVWYHWQGYGNSLKYVHFAIRKRVE